ncbi:methylenetetrahydrofolate--tRNA-(uracil(54)-C(5))-methyltransferase (FADH(2)-oxidizing) TrmFO [Pigmentibacter ruber]|uniref:methylenetetrahydrofolate--tRNA-(uracil(54)- C(5))-methyltransferase (FADH(2)-oxidizing) TrmFO n=1 Tax=Pigmentibacter ruber TaxID=2683196 RepID=UPI00131CB078|nr:methylenetetrahydrofolate--tRNA-(uracil(54)-C(5))-methyltransferase (FADH(2)-oxidizing) TrmFO [Pigmentibacter ruber]
MNVAVIGAGLAGSECAWILAEHYQLSVTLYEMKTRKTTPAQISPHLFAELVCSNSLKSKSRLNPAGTLKAELEKLGSLILPAARNAEVPAGETLAVDRELFSSEITQKLRNHKNIEIIEKVVESVDEINLFKDFNAIVIATGPLTDDALAESLRKLTKSDQLYFYDAIAPILDGDSINYDVAFYANRQSKTSLYEKKLVQNKEILAEFPDISNATLVYEKLTGLPDISNADEDGDYLNLPFNKEEYFAFVEKVLLGEKVPHKNFEEPKYFNGCQPIEVLAESGPRTLSFGPMKPKGLINPKTGKMPYAVVQLRKESLGDNAWNMVGFQTRLTWKAQKEIFSTIPGLENVEFFRLGSMHRNTYLVSPSVLNEDFSLKENNKIYLAGQIMGVEGYLESTAMGCFIGHLIGFKLTKQKTLSLPPANTSLGCLARFCIYSEPKKFTPMNIHWGLFNELSKDDIEKYSNNSEKVLKMKKIDKSTKREMLASRSEELFNDWWNKEFN